MDSFIDRIETPCVVIDEKKTVENIIEWQKMADDGGVALRPHVKTHKIPYFAKLQVMYGASGITCCKISEAEIMADGGLDDIFIAYPMVGENRLERAAMLNKRIGRLILSVDSMELATAMSSAAKRLNTEFEVRVEVDTGADRTGVRYGQARDVITQIAALPNLNVTGIYTFKHLVYKGQPTQDRYMAGNEEGRMMKQLADSLKASGANIKDISAGSSPTAEPLCKQGLVTEVRPGTYIFKDIMMIKEEVAKAEDISAHIYVRVVSTPEEGYAVVDAGNKCIPVDQALGRPPYNYESHAMIDGNDDLVLDRAFEEHGMIRSRSGHTGLKVGQILKLAPNHVCTAINLQNQVYVWDGTTLRKERVAARGALV